MRGAASLLSRLPQAIHTQQPEFSLENISGIMCPFPPGASSK